MKLAIMQPYLFPCLEYFRLVAAADKFIFLDDVNFQKSGWINRGRFLLHSRDRYITVPLSRASQYKKINRILVHKSDSWRWRTAESIRHSYVKAPNFGEINHLLLEVLFSEEPHIAELAKRSVIALAGYLGLKTEFVLSSSCYGNHGLRGEERVLDICRLEKTRHYLSLPVYRHLYDTRKFEQDGIGLRFTELPSYSYRRRSKTSCAGVSIVDALMFNHRDTVRNMLHA